MIYLVGGAPRIGKSIIGKKLASLVSAEFVSTDDLEMPKII
jgi:shikimate kinase